VCINLCPEIFKLKNGKSKIKEKIDLKKHENCIKEEIDSCRIQTSSRFLEFFVKMIFVLLLLFAFNKFILSIKETIV
jgi:hypothetical protein